MTESSFLQKLIQENWGPYDGWDQDNVRKSRDLVKGLFSYVLEEILGEHPESSDDYSAEYCVFGGCDIELRYLQKATKSATDIAKGIREITGCDVTVYVYELHSEFVYDR
jgi:hypothetical protein